MDGDLEELPILGEPLPVELANTWYDDGEEQIDFLDDEVAAIWLGAAKLAPPRFPRARLGELRALRDATRALFLEAVSEGPAPRSCGKTVTQFAALASPRVRLELSDGQPKRVVTWHGAVADRLLAQLAHEVIELVTGSSWEALRRCAAPDCPMFFVQQHRRRRFCHPTCSQRGRQAAYYRRRMRGGGDG